ncbi:Gfo/Idh/MocA family protein [Auraticoccus monumenti]|uniref:Predicted dehydrogenase n=1 Tax=Auraticoccus monumenti TaxID=675864 RepID=A0A1G6XTR8_9ACTN|nr:Gfo/Idh/MocA family oxidoreductase [Auraticoccus monumenti]SDD80777.1 Predicted dehydrogenase [Auraticoccus monumenti]
MSTPGGADRLRVGIVGCGSIARAHALSYTGHPRVDLVGVVDIDQPRAEAFAETHGSTAFASRQELTDAGVDLVSVATPPGSHTEVAASLLEAGCSVLLEKPPATALADMDVLAAADAASAGSLYVVFQHRHGSGARRASRLLQTGALGTPQVAVCETLWYRPDSYFLPEWRGTWSGEGGGPTLGHAIHQLDLLLHLMGPWETVTARAARIARPVEFEDVSLGLVTFASGAVGTVTTSLLSPRELSRIRVDTTSGTLEVDHVYGYRDADWSWTPVPDPDAAARLGRDPGLPAGGGTDGPGTPLTDRDAWAASADQDRPSNHRAQIEQLVDDLLAGREHQTTLASTRPTMELVTALYASALERQTVARTDLTEDHPYYSRLDGGRPAETVTARLGTHP